MQELRLATWNVWFRFGDWQARQVAIAHALHAVDADVVCLQEAWVEVGGRHQPAELAAALGLHHQRFVARYADRGVWIGNAILSRWPLSRVGSWAYRGWPGIGHFRTALAATVTTPAGPVRVATTHLSHRRSRRLCRLVEARAVRSLALADADGVPAVVAGDLNADPASPEVTELLQESAGGHLRDVWQERGAGAGFTWASTNPLTVRSKFPDRRLDYVLVRPAAGRGEPRGARLFGSEPVEGVQPSDHYGLLTILAP